MNIKVIHLALLVLLLGCNHPDNAIRPNNDMTHFAWSYFADKKAEVVYISRDTGRTWQPFATGLPPEATVSCFISDGAKVFASTEFHGIFLNEGGAGTWQSISGDLPKDVHIKAVEIVDHVLIIGTSKHGILTSSDGGKTWRQETNALNTIPVRCLLTVDDKVFAGTDQGIFISADKGVSWKHAYGTVQITGFTQLENNIYAGVMNGAVMTGDGGNTWRYIYQPYTLHDISNDGKYIYAMTLGDGLLKTNNDGVTWEQAGTFNLYTFEVKNAGNDLFAAQWTGIYHSKGEGETWNLIEGGLPDSTAFCTLENTKYGLIAGIGLRK